MRQRWHVIAVDLRGHGDSQWSPDGAYLVPYHVLDLSELIETLGMGPLTIVGHSFGGNLSTRCAALLPDRVHKLVVVDGLGPGPRAVARWAEVGAVQRTRNWIDQYRDPKTRVPRRFKEIDEGVARMSAANPHLSNEQARHLAAHGLRLHADGYGWKYDPLIGNFAPEDFAVDLSVFSREVRVPTLLCYGAESWTTNPETDGRAAQLRDRQTVVFEKAGHWVHHDQFDAFIATLLDFLAPGPAG